MLNERKKRALKAIGERIFLSPLATLYSLLREEG
jgi:hypothetical protein